MPTLTFHGILEQVLIQIRHQSIRFLFVVQIVHKVLNHRDLHMKVPSGCSGVHHSLLNDLALAGPFWSVPVRKRID